MPRDDDDDDTLDEGKPSPKAKPQDPPAAKPSRFHSRYLKDADGLGISQEEIEECKDNAELSALIRHERDRIAAEQTRNRQPARHREPVAQPVATSPPPPQPEPKYTFKKNLDHVDTDLREALQDLANDLVKATKRGDKDRIDEVMEEIKSLKEENAALRAKSHPLVRKANKILDTYPALFGTQDDREDPSSREAKLAKMVEEHIFGTMQEEGSYTGKPEKDIPAAVVALFPGVKPGGKESPPASQDHANGQPAKKSRVDTWADAGDVPPTDRNGAARTGKPGGTKAAVQKVREKRRELGISVGDDDIDDDIEDDDDI